MGELTRQVIDAHRHEAEQHGIQVQTGIRPAIVCGDPRLMEQLIGNLINNAVRHNVPGGRVAIKVDGRYGQGVLSVSNTGPEIPQEAIDRLFQPFQRLAPQRTSHGDGVGLGLAIVRAIADSHSVTVTAHPRPGGGLDIQATFPAAVALADAPYPRPDRTTVDQLG